MDKSHWDPLLNYKHTRLSWLRVTNYTNYDHHYRFYHHQYQLPHYGQKLRLYYISITLYIQNTYNVRQLFLYHLLCNVKLLHISPRQQSCLRIKRRYTLIRNRNHWRQNPLNHHRKFTSLLQPLRSFRQHLQ